MINYRLNLRNVAVIFACLVVTTMFFACKKSTEKQITAFSFVTPQAVGVINESAKTITIDVPAGTNVTALTPSITVSDKATVSPASGVKQNFTNPVTYTVKAEDGSTVNYMVTLTIGGVSMSGLVKRIIFHEKGSIPDTLKYIYDTQNRLIAITKNDWSYVHIDYPTANTIEVRDDWNQSSEFTLNNDGHVTKIEYEYESEIFEYENGYLKKITRKNGNTVYSTIAYTWENGNLMSWKYSNVGKNFSYGTTLYKEANVAPYMTVLPYIPYPPTLTFDPNWLLPVAWFGKCSKNLPTSTYKYETNSNGYVTKVYRTDDLFLEIQY